MTALLTTMFYMLFLSIIVSETTGAARVLLVLFWVSAVVNEVIAMRYFQ